MGSRISHVDFSEWEWENPFAKLKRLAKKVVKKTADMTMISHVRVLVEELDLGPCKLKLPKNVENEHSRDAGEGGPTDDGSNTDINSGMGTAGSARSLSDDINFLMPAENIPDKRPSMAWKLVNKLKVSWKTLDLYSIFLDKRQKSIKLQSLMQHALDCQSAVEYLEGAIDKYTKEMQLNRLPRKKKTSFTLRKRSNTFTTAEGVINPGTEFSGRIRIPANQPSAEQRGLFDASDTTRFGMFTFSDNSFGFSESNNFSVHTSQRETLRNLDPNFNNLQQNGDRPYQLFVLRQRKDELGQPYWIGRHQTYQGRRDKQTVLISMLKARSPKKTSSHPNEIYIEDFETRCVGMITTSYPKQIIGNVKQLKNGREGYDLPSSIEHRFTLMRQETSKVQEVLQLKEQLYEAKQARALAFAAWCGSVSRSQILNLDKGLPWCDIVEDVVWLVDETGCYMRRLVHLLNHIEFASPSERKQTLEKLAEKGLSRGNVHRIWEAATSLLAEIQQNTPKACQKAEGYRPRRDVVDNFCEKVVGRLQPLYERFDQALRRADQRVCTEYKVQWMKTNHAKLVKQIDKRSFSSKSSRHEMLSQLQTHNDEFSMLRKELLKKASRNRLQLPSVASSSEASAEEEPTCTICMEPLEAKLRIYVTPCKHAFHVTCLNEWFMESSVCPICRMDFSQVEEDTSL